jgi:hypothetical protein
VAPAARIQGGGNYIVEAKTQAELGEVVRDASPDAEVYGLVIDAGQAGNNRRGLREAALRALGRKGSIEAEGDGRGCCGWLYHVRWLRGGGYYLSLVTYLKA